MMSNPVQMLMAAVRNGADPRNVLQQMARNNPQIAQASRMINGKSDEELKQIAVNMCRERGTTPEAVLKSLMQR